MLETVPPVGVVREPGSKDQTARRMDNRIERLVIIQARGDPERPVEPFGEISDRDLVGQRFEIADWIVVTSRPRAARASRQAEKESPLAE